MLLSKLSSHPCTMRTSSRKNSSKGTFCPLRLKHGKFNLHYHYLPGFRVNPCSDNFPIIFKIFPLCIPQTTCLISYFQVDPKCKHKNRTHNVSHTLLLVFLHLFNPSFLILSLVLRFKALLLSFSSSSFSPL